MQDRDELTPAMRAMLGALPRTRVPSAALEERVVGSLRARGLLRRLVRSPRLGAAGWRRLGQIAAAAGIFLAGIGVGQVTRSETAVALRALEAERPVERAEVAPVIGRMGAAYAASIALIPQDTVDSLARIAMQVARTTFLGAAMQLARRMPADSLAALLAPAGVRLTASPVAVDRSSFAFGARY